MISKLVLMNKKNIAYTGQKYCIEWYFNDNGKSEVFVYFKSLPIDRQEKFF